MKTTIHYLLFFFFSTNCFCQNPWNNPLNMARSSDGITFNSPTIFQDSSGVPSVIKWKGDTLVAVFQWFRLPNPSLSWDRVAVKFSYDNGLNWTQPKPIIINDLPAKYQRPFDPTLTVINKDSIRIYFSSSDGIPAGGLDSEINTYSAISADGINYIFELNPRVDEVSTRVIDPALIRFNNSWHYLSPIGSPQQGAFHYISSDGIKFMKVPNIPSDNTHNWTGNYMVEDNTELRFYGCGPTIWYNSSPNGGVWNGYTNTNIHGGDPSVVKVSDNNYLIIFVGQPYTNIDQNGLEQTFNINIFPNPANDILNIDLDSDFLNSDYFITDQSGKQVISGKILGNTNTLKIQQLLPGVYTFQIGKVKKQFIIVEK